MINTATTEKGVSFVQGGVFDDGFSWCVYYDGVNFGSIFLPTDDSSIFLFFLELV